MRPPWACLSPGAEQLAPEVRAVAAERIGSAEDMTAVAGSRYSASGGWQEGPEGLRVRPSLKLTAMQVRSDSPEYEVRQSDRMGILSTTSRARLPDAPETVFGLGAGFEATGSGGLRMRFGYAGAILDGKFIHAVGGGLQMKF